jgi:hypothetical protein
MVIIQNLWGLNAFGCKWLYLGMVYWLSKMMVWKFNKTSAIWDSVWKPHTILQDTSGNLIRTLKYLQTPPDYPGAKQSTLTLCESFFRCFWKHLQLWRSIQDAPSRIAKCRSFWYLCADRWQTSINAESAAPLGRILRQRPRPLRSYVRDLILYSHSNGSYIPTRHFVLS